MASVLAIGMECDIALLTGGQGARGSLRSGQPALLTGDERGSVPGMEECQALSSVASLAAEAGRWGEGVALLLQLLLLLHQPGHA